MGVTHRTKKSSCPVYREICAEHGFSHGAEAEELRKGIQEILKASYRPHVDENTTPADAAENAASRIEEALTDLLDEVDARDSLAWLEAKKRA